MRPCKKRRVCCQPYSSYFKPRGVPCSSLDEVVLKPDEIEAIRLADLEELYQEEAAKKMNISRPTFGRIIDSAHKKIAHALLEGKALRLDVKQKGKIHENLCPHKKQQRPPKRSL
ncbi:MAG: protein of unknown function DUF134 [uncultured bacterium]|nr:MAG: protein of unknown function DUF134 [uncultured bacterium]HLD44782.1 DUF134 domain-containing protein [bacterium]